MNPTDMGRHWAVPNKVLLETLGKESLSLTVQQKLDVLDKQGLIYWPPKGKMPRFKRYLNEEAGVPIVDVVADINPIGGKRPNVSAIRCKNPKPFLNG
jgi:site-specific DNA-methyltransferase (adenine-specific)